jgi:hypothetical protein
MRKAWYGSMLSEILTVNHNSQIIGDKASLTTASLQTVVESWVVVFANGAPCGMKVITSMLLKYLHLELGASAYGVRRVYLVDLSCKASAPVSRCSLAVGCPTAGSRSGGR